MASIGNVQRLDSSEAQLAWVEAHSTLRVKDPLYALIRAEEEAARQLGYHPWEDWSKDPHITLVRKEQDHEERTYP